MQFLEPSTLIEFLNWRYATKQFDPARKIPPAVWEALEDSLILTPSSYGLQPWQFFVVTDPDLKAALRPHSWNQPQVTDCSHHVVFATRRDVDEAFVDKHVARIAEVRGVAPESLAFYKDMMASDILNGPRSERVQEWAARQVYIALGNFMTAAALLGVDTCPMEGLDPAKYDEILGLPSKGFHAVVACPTGYRAEGDKYADMPKVRFPKSELIQTL
ncbi:MAG: NAD(P)H-dependent oxidoreductase [Verrucomicrobiaceae bacterium]|nr:MAG: NAD(P)H-dependent oxidoreductase [Verrucomicrobiaceae bacterium]